MKDNMPGMNMPDISFERSMNHNYMILSKCSFFGKADDQSGDYRTKMLLENRIQGLLPVTHRLINGESRYYYEINSLQSLDRLYARTEIRYDVLRRLLSGCVSLFDKLEEYLLDGTQIIIKPEMIYIDVETMEPYFVCYPDYEGDVRVNFMEFIDGLLTRIDHTDEHAVMLGYQIYRYTRNPNYVISEIGTMIEHVNVNMAKGTLDSGQTDMDTAKDIKSYSVDGNMRTTNDSCKSNEFTEQNSFDAQSYEDEKDTERSEKKHGKKMRNTGDLIGGVFCVFVSLCAGTIVLGARLISTFQLEGNSELYLYGAMGMSLVAAVLFFSCHIRKRRQDKAAELLDDGGDCEEVQYYTSIEDKADNCWNNNSKVQSMVQGTVQNIGTSTSNYCSSTDSSRYQKYPNIDALEHDDFQETGFSEQNAGFPKQSIYRNTIYAESNGCNETVYLGDCVVEERMLCGRINGRQVNISLERLPMTVGKLAKVSDFVINDTSVSKMHARFEERDGRVCICDLNSTNGTVHNGELLKINQSVVLEPGDRLRFGRTSFTYC